MTHDAKSDDQGLGALALALVIMIPTTWVVTRMGLPRSLSLVLVLVLGFLILPILEGVVARVWGSRRRH